MSMSDPVGDTLTRIRNALATGKTDTLCRSSKFIAAILEVMREEGYLRGYKVDEKERNIKVALKYYGGSPVIESIKRISRPSLRRYASSDEIKPVMNGLGIAIISTSQGVMSDHTARERGIGGEIICHIT